MKKLILAGAVALFGLSDAQINRGTVYVSGQVNYTQDENKGTHEKIQDFKVIPTVGVFVAPNLAVGTGLGLKNSKTEYTQTLLSGPFATIIDYTGKTNAVVVAPFIRKYWTLSDKLYFFGQLEIPMEFGKINHDALVTYTDGAVFFDQETLSNERKYTSIGVNVKPGLDYFLNKNWTIEATIGEFGYTNFKYKNEDNTDRKNYNFGLNLSSISFGVKYVFAK